MNAILEGVAEVHLVNPLFIPVSSRSEDRSVDPAWVAEIVLNGLYKPSYIPQRPIRALRDLMRTHRKLVEER